MPRDGTATRERILDRAEDLVLDQGFAATTVDEVIAASASSKGAFFHHFPSKQDLGRALVARYARADVALLHQAMDAAQAASPDPGAQLLAFVRFFEDIADEIAGDHNACLYVAFLYDRQLTANGGTEAIAAAVEEWHDVLLDKLRAAAAVHAPVDDLDLSALAHHVFVTFEGSFILARTLGDGSHMRRQLAVLRRSLAALVGIAA